MRKRGTPEVDAVDADNPAEILNQRSGHCLPRPNNGRQRNFVAVPISDRQDWGLRKSLQGFMHRVNRQVGAFNNFGDHTIGDVE
jgi:hypothetical protein